MNIKVNVNVWANWMRVCWTEGRGSSLITFLIKLQLDKTIGENAYHNFIHHTVGQGQD